MIRRRAVQMPLKGWYSKPTAGVSRQQFAERRVSFDDKSKLS
jgi:hypothetical protein